MKIRMWLYLKKAELGMDKEKRQVVNTVTKFAVKRSLSEIAEIKEKYYKNKLLCQGTELTDAEEYIFQLMEAASREQAIPSKVRRKAKEMKGMIAKQNIDEDRRNLLYDCLEYSLRLNPTERNELKGNPRESLITMFNKYLYGF